MDKRRNVSTNFPDTIVEMQLPLVLVKYSRLQWFDERSSITSLLEKSRRAWTTSKASDDNKLVVAYALAANNKLSSLY